MKKTPLDFSGKTIKELESTLKMMKVISITLSIIIIVLLAITVYGIITKENNATFLALFVVGVSCGAILPSQISTIKKIKAELDSRKK